MAMQTTKNLVAGSSTFILAGGEGRRLSPLTKYRAKPLVPFGGCYRIVDFTLSNCLNSGLKRVCMLTQHESESVSTYLRKGWGRVGEGEFVFTGPPAGGKRYAGTADAVLQNLAHLDQAEGDCVLILSADHIYKMDYRDLLRFHVSSGADATIATVDHPRELSAEVGVLDVDDSDRVVGFEEKPHHPRLRAANARTISASMGVYVFNRQVLRAAMTRSDGITDLAKDLIPGLIRSYDVRAYRHVDKKTKSPLYWRDVGTPEAYYAANMDLIAPNPWMDPYDSDWPIRSGDRPWFSGQDALCEVGRGTGIHSIIARGMRARGASVYQSVLFPFVVLESKVDVRQSILMPGVVIERGARVRRAIIDANVVIEAGDDIGYDTERDRSRFRTLANGVVVVSTDHSSGFLRKEVTLGVRRVPSGVSVKQQRFESGRPDLLPKEWR
jgi:glucose-1-phosphate adenylyltransferase